MRRLAGLLVLSGLLSLAATESRSQSYTWTAREDLNAALPGSIRVFEGVEASISAKAFYVEAKPDDGIWQLDAVRSEDADGVEPTTALASRAEAFVAVNGGFFGSGQAFSLIASDGVVITPNIGALNRSGITFYPTRGAFARLEDGSYDVAWIYDVGGTTYFYPDPNPNAVGSPAPQPSATWPDGGAPWPLTAGVGGGPVLVEGGQVRVTYDQEVMFGSGVELNARQTRTAVGYRADGTLLLAVFQAATLPEAATVMAGLGAEEALNLDGGGSSTLVVDDALLWPTTQRQVTSALVLRPPGGGGGGGNTGAEYFFDTGDTCCYREVGDWFESANTPYYGGTKARLNGVGVGEDRAVFVFDGIPAGTYEVAATWASSFNRATNTPFDVYQGGVPTRKLLDQTIGGGLWNLVGTFDLVSGDSLAITDDASGTTLPAYVVADAIRLVDVTGVAIEPGLPLRDARLSVWPNPARDVVTVRAGSTGRETRGEVVDLLGRVVHRFDVDAAGGDTRIDLPRLPAGLYAIRLVGDPAGRHAFVVIRP